MRKIEFRAWLKKDKKMVEVKSIHFGTKKIMYGYSESSHCYGNVTCKFDDCELMQFTGLTDKNGTKIFEGDILKSPFDKKFFEVFYDECRFFVKTNRGTVLRGVQSAIDHYELEVIGNIYDNPELLEAK